MTISSTTNRVEYNGNGVTTAFSFPYLFLANGDLKVYEDGTLKTITTHYTVTGAGDPSGGTVTFLTAPAAGTGNVVLLNDPARTQGLDLVENDPMPAASLEQSLDRLTIIAQRLGSLVDRSFKVADTVSTGPAGLNKTAAQRASQYLVFNSSGDLDVGSGSGTDTALRTDLGSTANGKGASLVSIEDAGALYTGTTVETALTEVVTKANTQTITGAKTFGAAAVFNDAVTIAGALTLNAASPIVLEGATADGFETTIAVTDPTADNTLTIPNETGTFVTTLPASLKPLTSGTVIPTTSGTAHDFTGIPSWVKRITIGFAGVSMSGGTDQVLVQIGDAGGVETTGYTATCLRTVNAAASAASNSGGGFNAFTNAAGDVFSGVMTLVLIDSATNTWVASWAGKVSTTVSVTGGGDKALSATLDRVRITRSGTTDSFDAGAVNILYE